jgi:hypothetical protein
MPLSEQSRSILEAIAKGHSYEQILVQELAMTYHDIFQAAAEALQAVSQNQPSSGPAKAWDVSQIRHEHPRAYAPWAAGDDDKLRQLFRSGANTTEMSTALQRQPGAIRSRLLKLSLTRPGSQP